jgi:UDP-N-acetylmuramoyl-tripeptide--D-alanyl-D-alanine ligase
VLAGQVTVIVGMPTAAEDARRPVRRFRPTVSDQATPSALLGFDAAGLATAAGGELEIAGDRPIHGGAVDSRRVRPGEAFFALPGARVDGHAFLSAALAAGAAALVVTRALLEDERTAAVAAGASVIRVPDGLRALQRTAAAWRTHFTPRVVGVTGSLAKTSTKEAIAETLSERWRVHRNEGNENNEVGLPLTLLRLAPEHEVAVLEMGMYTPGEIAVLAELARPDVGVLTAVRATHLSRAGSLEAIERGKGELLEALPPDGIAVLNADDPIVTRMHPRTRARVLRYGFHPAADVRAEDVESRGEAGMAFTLVLPTGPAQVETPALGRHGVHNEIAAAAVAWALGLSTDEIVRGITRGHRAPHRTALLRAGPWRVLDDSYNAAPDSMAAALDLLRTLPGRRIAVLGEMLELGDQAEQAHRRVGAQAAEAADLVLVVGDGARGIAQGAVDAGLAPERVLSAPDAEGAVDPLVALLTPGDVVLVKASRGIGLDRVVDALVARAPVDAIDEAGG